LYEDILDKSRTESGLCGKSAGKPSDESDLCCEILGKPTDEADARRMLRLLRGRPHRVMTGVSLWELPAGRNLTAYDISTVYFRDYPDETIEEYLRVEQPYDKAGSYAIQSFATGKYHPLAEKIDGDLENVIGLPMHLVRRMLDAMLQP
jgi:septum formation protein